MSRRVFRDFDEFADSIAGLTGRFVPTARSSSDWWVDKVSAGTLSLQQVQIGGPATLAGAGESGCFAVGVPTTRPQSIRIDGQRLDASSIVVLKQNQLFTYAGEDVTRWAGVTLRAPERVFSAELVERLQALESACTRTDRTWLEKLQWLVERICCANPGIDLADPAAEKAVEHETVALIERALERCLALNARPLGRPHLSRERVIARALELMRANEGQPLFTSDLCRAAGVSERTLRNAFNEYFGVGPIRLLKVRQLREIRAALLAADPARETVASIAGRFGVWDFSLFARNYKKLFGETPSQTLHTQAAGVDRAQEISWLRYAARKFSEDVIYAVPQSRGAAGGSSQTRPHE